MKKVQRTARVIPLLILALLLAILPVAGIACNCGDDSDDDNVETLILEMQAPYGKDDASGIALTQFKQIVEEKTNGAITIVASYGGEDISHEEQFGALQTGELSLAVQAPHFSRLIDNHFDFSGSLAGLIVTKEHYQAVLSNNAYAEWYNGLYEDMGIKFLGMVDGYRFAGGFLTNYPCESIWDLEDHEIWNGTPGNLEPYEELLGCSAHVYAEDRDEIAQKVMIGEIDILTIPLLYAYGGFYEIPGITHYLVRSFYGPNSILMNLDDWEKMDSELQDIIMNEVMPELEEAVEAAVIQQAKVALPALVTALGEDNVYMVTAADEDTLYKKLISYGPFEERAAGMNQEMYEIIKNLRPTKTVFDQDIISVLQLAEIYEAS